MYLVATESVFRAGHSLVLRSGLREKRHEHDWRVRATVGRTELDEDGLVVDFHLLQERLAEAVLPLTGAEELGDEAVLAGANPSAEVVARFLYGRLEATLPRDVRLLEMRVWEGPGCWASYQLSPKNMG